MIPALGPWLVAVSTASFEACVPAPPPAQSAICRVYSGLQPGTSCAYELNGYEGVGRTLPASGPLRFAVLGDSGNGSSAQHAVALRLQGEEASFILHLGDVVYPHGALSDYGPRYFQPYRRVLQRTAVYPTVGNHDYANQLRGSARGKRRFEEAYQAVHRKPAYYSFDAGPAHFISLDSNRAFGIDAAEPFGPGTAQDTWLRRDLAASSAPWKIIFLHVPVHASEDHGDHEALRRWLEPLLAQHRVQAVFQGHDHIYERSKPLNGTVFVTVGTGGAALHPRRDRPNDPRFAARVSAHGFVHAELEADQLRLNFIDSAGAVRDSAVLSR